MASWCCSLCVGMEGQRRDCLSWQHGAVCYFISHTAHLHLKVKYSSKNLVLCCMQSPWWLTSRGQVQLSPPWVEGPCNCSYQSWVCKKVGFGEIWPSCNPDDPLTLRGRGDDRRGHPHQGAPRRTGSDGGHVDDPHVDDPHVVAALPVKGKTLSTQLIS